MVSQTPLAHLFYIPYTEGESSPFGESDESRQCIKTSRCNGKNCRSICQRVGQ
ncbi:Uncharacterised protein [Vibrio cholerae]|nr:Uncharacterised protein [Vibrio cholerae]